MRTRTLVACLVPVLLVAASGAAAVGFGGRGTWGGTRTPSAAVLPPATAQVTRQTMVDTDDEPGDLGFGATNSLVGRVPGVLTMVPLAGDVIRRGQPIYRADNQPVVLMYGDVSAYRTLGPGTSGADVREFEDNLTALGYTGFTVDDTYSAGTATAVRRWQKDLGLAQTGQVELGRVLFAPGAIRIDSVTAGVNESTGDDHEVLRYAGTTRLVTVRLAVSKQRLARKGVAVQVRMPDGTMAAGVVDRVYTVIEQGPADGPPDTRIEALVSLTDPAAGAGIEAAVVTVVFSAGERRDVLSVPVAALVALADGGYGVEVVDGSTTHYLRVQTGLFANGRVEVTGDGLREGMTVGMPE